MKELPSMHDELNEGTSQQHYLCSECQTGVYRHQYCTYFTWLNQELITVPNFPAWVCDVCGRREYDIRAINWLNTLLNPEAGKRSRS
ncbi:MAG: YgiT-type zinc finger protein [Chloroflexota bacterium]|nr:YgiT-type zinc finger protein [Chloroflexota bacterium]